MRNNTARRVEDYSHAITEEFTVAKPYDARLMGEVLAGLSKTPKEISSKWFYDEPGSALFDLICDLPEYYPTRMELAIMRKHSIDMARCLGPEIALIEFGSGTSLKTRLLLDRLESPSVYVPVDIACTHLLDAASSIARDYPWLTIAPLCADFTRPLQLPKRVAVAKRRVIYFPGSTLGNFEIGAAQRLLTLMRDLAGSRGAVLIGIDLKKDFRLLERAYNDSRGITARFNLNALRHINRALLANFDLNEFEHQAVWVDPPGRIEMRLVSRRDQSVRLDGRMIHIAAGEYIRTEYSHKYTLESFGELAVSAGLNVREVWCDAGHRFSVQLLEPKAGVARAETKVLSF